MRQVERDLGTSLAWMAANHYDTKHPHTHIVVRGVSEGEAPVYETKLLLAWLTRAGLQALNAHGWGRYANGSRPSSKRNFAHTRKVWARPKRLNGIILGSEDPDLGQLTRQQICPSPNHRRWG